MYVGGARGQGGRQPVADPSLIGGCREEGGWARRGNG